MSDFNEQVIAEFRANDGVVGGYFENQTVLLLHNTGAKSGKERVTPVVTLPNDEGNYFIIASAGGSDKHPAWYHNIVANPSVIVEVGTEQFDATARPAEEPERTELYEKMEAKNPVFTKYKNGTDREIPVIVLEKN